MLRLNGNLIGISYSSQEVLMTCGRDLKSREEVQSTNAVVERLRSKPEMTVIDQVYMAEVINPNLESETL